MGEVLIETQRDGEPDSGASAYERRLEEPNKGIEGCDWKKGMGIELQLVFSVLQKEKRRWDDTAHTIDVKGWERKKRER